MELTYLKKEGNTRLILIFAGWSTKPSFYIDTEITGWDVAVVSRYSEPQLDTLFLSGYCTIYLFAWSLGVAEADRTLPPDRITAAFAINGTVTPLSDTCGIPPAIYHGTADGLSPRNLAKFRRRMMPDADSFRTLFPEEESTDECRALAEELRAIASRHNNSEELPRLRWTRAYVGNNDRIFPPANQIQAWRKSGDTDIICIDDAHYIPVSDIASGVIADTLKVSGHFSRAAETYDSAAVAQQMIALHLNQLVRRHIAADSVSDLLEIGPGTGFLTRAYSAYLKPHHTDFVDITQTGPFSLCGEMCHHTADAELWIRECRRNYDLILSSSAVQWFADIPAFFAQCGRILRPGALMAIATFAPGNLAELDTLRPAPLLYPSLEALTEMLPDTMTLIDTEESQMRVEFENRRRLLLHLKKSGVAGSGSPALRKISKSHESGMTSATSSISLPSRLTYKPIFLLARKKK